MSRFYRVEVQAIFDKDFDTITDEDTEFLLKEVMHYFVYPEVRSETPYPLSKSRETYDYFDVIQAKWSEVRGGNGTHVLCGVHRYFRLGYSEEEFRANLHKQIERFKTELTDINSEKQ